MITLEPATIRVNAATNPASLVNGLIPPTHAQKNPHRQAKTNTAAAVAINSPLLVIGYSPNGERAQCAYSHESNRDIDISAHAASTS